MLPAASDGGAAFWIGLAPADGSYLLQPIIPKWLGDGWYVFTETFDWHSGDDYQSDPVMVEPGTEILTILQLISPLTYLSSIRTSQGWQNITISVPEYVPPLSVVYFVLEHQPESCQELPASDLLSFTGIKTVPSVLPFEPAVRDPACGSLAKVPSDQEVDIVWQSDGQI